MAGCLHGKRLAFTGSSCRPARSNPMFCTIGAERLTSLKRSEQSLCCEPKRSTGESSTRDTRMNGRWKKLKERCTPMDEAYDMVQLPWVLRKAVDFLLYMEVENTIYHFKTVLKAGNILDIVECYPWTGEEIEHPRRDNRFGKHKASVVSTPQGPMIKCRWGSPFRGWAKDTFTLSDDGSLLTVRTHMELVDSNQKCDYETVYTKVEM